MVEGVPRLVAWFSPFFAIFFTVSVSPFSRLFLVGAFFALILLPNFYCVYLFFIELLVSVVKGVPRLVAWFFVVFRKFFHCFAFGFFPLVFCSNFLLCVSLHCVSEFLSFFLNSVSRLSPVLHASFPIFVVVCVLDKLRVALLRARTLAARVCSVMWYRLVHPLIVFVCVWWNSEERYVCFALFFAIFVDFSRYFVFGAVATDFHCFFLDFLHLLPS